MGPYDSPERGDAGRAPAAPLGPHTPVSAVVGLLAIEPVLVAPNERLDAVIAREGASPSTRVIGVVDPDGVLIGVVTSQDLVAAVAGRLAPGALLTEIHDADGMEEYARFVEAAVAGDLMQLPAALPVTATLAEAFHLMRRRHLSGIYVVDSAGRPTGYIDGLELAAAAAGG